MHSFAKSATASAPAVRQFGQPDCRPTPIKARDLQSHLPRRSIRALFQHGVLDSAANSVINLEVIFVTGHSAKIFGLVRSGPERGLVFDISVSEGAAMDNRNEKGTRFRVEKLEERIAPTIVQVNGGGNIPNGEANGVPASNPAGYEPPGWNK